ncbi:MAG TPA: hypothetical protein VMH83_04200 [Candidatus Acidoferrum sp.]|nr:hypothetical protein [Candidatus Acidoferrum sp.]
MKGLKVPGALLAAATLAACANGPALPVTVPDFVGEAENACLPEAIVMTETLKKQQITARILVISTPGFSHAAVVFHFPLQDPRLWVWDSVNDSVEISVDQDNPVQIAAAWLRTIHLDDAQVHASFLL